MSPLGVVGSPTVVTSTTPVLRVQVDDPNTAVGFEFRVDATSDCLAPFVEVSPLLGAVPNVAGKAVATWAVSPKKLTDGTTYYWCARARSVLVNDDSGWSPESSVGALTVRIPSLGVREYWPVWQRGPLAVNQATGNLVLGFPGPDYDTGIGPLEAAPTRSPGTCTDGSARPPSRPHRQLRVRRLRLPPQAHRPDRLPRLRARLATGRLLAPRRDRRQHRRGADRRPQRQLHRGRHPQPGRRPHRLRRHGQGRQLRRQRRLGVDAADALHQPVAALLDRGLDQGERAAARDARDRRRRGQRPARSHQRRPARALPRRRRLGQPLAQQRPDRDRGLAARRRRLRRRQPAPDP